MKHTLLDFIKLQLFEVLPPVLTGDLNGKTVVVTGANIGIGLETAIHFARMGPGKLVVACRSEKKGREAVDEIRQRTGCDTVELRLLDLADFGSVKAFVRTFENNDDRVDILVENAGIIPRKGDPEFTTDKWEVGAQVNNLSASLLALLLLPRMLYTAQKYNTQPRLVVVSSSVHYWTSLDKSLVHSTNPGFFRRFAHEEYLVGPISPTRYHQTKLLNILFARALDNKLKKGPIIINTVCPGFCYSGLRRDSTGIQSFIYHLLELLIARTSEEGARQVVWAAIGKEGNADALRGAFVACTSVTEPSDYVVSKEGEEAQDRIWDDLIVELAKIDPRVNEIVQKFF